jgi:tetratricopeptide (TPR) repeat protein
MRQRQLLLFPETEARARIVPLVTPPPAQADSADAWHLRGRELEARSAAQARCAYLRALAIEPRHPRALIDLGRLYHHAGDLARAEQYYRRAAAAAPQDATAAFNLGVALEDEGRWAEARASYERAVRLDPSLADAHFNLARLAEMRGERFGALRHLLAYRRLTRAGA